MRLSELHLLRYRQKMLEYLQNIQSRHTTTFRSDPLMPFSSPFDPEGYADNSITHDLITELFLMFHERGRKKESDDYLKTLTGESTLLSDGHFRDPTV